MLLYSPAVSVYGQKETSRAGHAFAKRAKDLFPLAEEMCRHFKAALPYAITEGLFRVDLMMRDDGAIVVNEFESLEATFKSAKSWGSNNVGSAPGDPDNVVTNFLVQFWLDIINTLV
jgi:hypothetical protein